MLNDTQRMNLERDVGYSEHTATDNTYVDHSKPQHHLTLAQRSLFIAYFFVLCIWVFRRFLHKFNLSDLTRNAPALSPHKNDSNLNFVSLENGLDPQHRLKNAAFGQSQSDGDNFYNIDTEKSSVLGTDNPSVGVNNLGIVENLKDRNAIGHSPDDPAGKGGQRSLSIDHEVKSQSTKTTPSNAPRTVSLDEFLTKAVLFGGIMVFFYFCDYFKLFPQGQRTYSRDTFLFLVFLLFLVALCCSVAANKDKILNREQTEEWKGWMQVMFVWYHYFRAKEFYNWIRVYIACYVWMTGFGNFSFFWIRKDFSMWRMLKMLFRLNFLVIFVTLVTNNEYMLYYICAMHTYWFLTVYVFMRVLNSWNTNRVKMAAKFVAYAVCNAIIFDIPSVSQNVFRPVQFILGLHNDRGDVMHEWSFRAGLDHWACFLGMVCAYNYPTVEEFSNYLDSPSPNGREKMRKTLMRMAIGVVAVFVGVFWYFGFMRDEKYAYNAHHPYSSMIPIVTFIVLRNLHPLLRSFHLATFAWLGRVTLETYLSQLHIYLLANATTLLVYIPDYPLLNFSLATIIYLTISHGLFHITNDSSSFLITQDPKQLTIHITAVVALFGISTTIAYCMYS